MRTVAAALLVLVLGAGCAGPPDRTIGVGSAPTREAYAAEVARACGPLYAPGSGADLEAGVARLRSVRDAVRALPTPPADGPEIERRFLDPLDRMLAANVEAARIVDDDPSEAELKRALELLDRADKELTTMQSFFADFDVPECGTVPS